MRIQPGQGSINITYHGDVAVVYDAGVSSQQMHSKLLSLAQSEPTTILTPKRKTTAFEEQKLSIIKSGSTTTPDKSVNTPKIATTQKETYSVNSPKKFKDALQGIKTVIFFGSHSDNDHWNLLSLIDQDVSILCIMNDMNGHDAKESSDLHDFLLRKNVYHINTEKLPIIKNMSFPDFYKTHIARKISKLANLSMIGDKLSDLSGIYLWYLNPKSESSNGKSYIISESFQDIGLTVFFTGDAEDETFQTMPNNIRDVLSEKCGVQQGDTVAVVMPHHGSRHHSSFIDKLCPDMYFVSSGNGAQYPHPHMDLIKKIDQTNVNMKPFWERNFLTNCPSGCFYFSSTAKKSIINQINIIAKKQKNLPLKKKSPHQKYTHHQSSIRTKWISHQFYRENAYGLPVILGTNFGGELFVKKNGDIAQECNFCLFALGKNYVIDISKRAQITSDKLEGTPHKDVFFSPETQNFYYQISNKTVVLYYMMEEIREELKSEIQEAESSSDETASLTDSASDDADSPIERMLDFN